MYSFSVEILPPMPQAQLRLGIPEHLFLNAKHLASSAVTDGAGQRQSIPGEIKLYPLSENHLNPMNGLDSLTDLSVAEVGDFVFSVDIFRCCPREDFDNSSCWL